MGPGWIMVSFPRVLGLSSEEKMKKASTILCVPTLSTAAACTTICSPELIEDSE